jgi:hypothetical protein
MTHVHDTYHEDVAAGFGIATGYMFAILALVVAAVIAGVVLLAAHPWDDESNAPPNNNPGIEQPANQGGDTAPQGQ